MEHPLVSVIIPVYKVEPYLRKCVDSVLAQTYTNLEVILVDDGSPDGCPAICDEYAAKDARVRVIHKKNGGLSDARNVGICAAMGEWICFVDSDDLFADNHAVREVSEIIKKHTTDIVFCPGIARFSDMGMSDFICLPEKTDVSPIEVFRLGRKHKCIFCAQLFVVRRTFLAKHHILFMKDIYHEDMEWIPRLLTAGNPRISVFSGKFYLYRITPDSITSFFNQKRFDSFMYVLARLKQLYAINAGERTFLRCWFNMNVYNLVICMETSCFCDGDFFSANSEVLEKLFKDSSSLLDKRNRCISFMSRFSWKLFYRIRRVIK